jgi:hypothetical protein
MGNTYSAKPAISNSSFSQVGTGHRLYLSSGRIPHQLQS